jgi:Protein of unknown function (DUF1440)
MPSNGRLLIGDIILGAAAGAAATWAMDAVTTLLYEREPAQVKKRENKARGGETAYEKLAGKLTDGGKKQRKQVGSAIHWSLGVSSGAFYGLLRNRSRYVGLGSGLAYGLAMYLALDEGLLAVTKLSPPPGAFPWQAHARGLAGHLVLGAILDGVFDVADLIA